MDQVGISKLDLKRQNRMQVLKILKQQGPTSRIDIAGILELTRAAVTIITNEMIQQGIIQEIGEYKHLTEKAPRGRKKILIDINHNYKFVLGVTIEENVVSVGLSTLFGAVLDKRNLDITESVSYEAIIDFAKKSSYDILNDNCLNKSNILGIGVGIFPSMYGSMGVNTETGKPNFSKLKKVAQEITSLPIVFDNSVKGTAMANIDFLKNRSPDRINTAFLQYGNSLHYAVTNLNDPIKSYDNRTDFVDRIIIDPNEEVCEICGKRGCAKSLMSPKAIIKNAKKVYSKERTPYLWNMTNGNVEDVKIDLIYDANNQGDEGIVEIFDKSFSLLAVLINNLYFTTNPQKIILHNFRTVSDHFELTKKKVAEIAGEEVANSLQKSIIEDKHRFLSGCAIAIRELFYTRGGFDIHR